MNGRTKKISGLVISLGFILMILAVISSVSADSSKNAEKLVVEEQAIDEVNAPMVSSSPSAIEISPSASISPAWWTTVASTGTVDEADISAIRFGGPYAEVTRISFLPPRPAVIRYNVVAVNGLIGNAGIELQARFLDTGENSSVILRLYEFNLTNGIQRTKLILNSNSFMPNNAYQIGRASICSGRFDFDKNAYYVEAYLLKMNSSARAGLGGIQISNVVC